LPPPLLSSLVCVPVLLYGSSGQDGGADLEVFDVDLVKAQECGLKGAQFDAVFGAFILVLVNVLAISAGAFDCSGKGEHSGSSGGKRVSERGSLNGVMLEHIFTICQAKNMRE
jgi:hypothetical protein